LSSLHRLLSVLELFTPESPAWTAEGIAERLACSLPTAYRHVRALVGAGLLRGDAGASYVLGTRIIELDWQIRSGDPLIIAARERMEALAQRTGCDTVLGTIYGERIVTVHHAVGAEPVGASYGRGRRMPLFRGALSKCMLSALPRARVRKLHAAHAGDASPRAPGWDALLAELLAVRKAGFAVTRGELDPGLVGIAVPLVNATHRITAALGFVMSMQRYSRLDVPGARAMLQDCSRAISTALEQRGQM
jgi:DNA-binding IclR family transcriptional regulator